MIRTFYSMTSKLTTTAKGLLRPCSRGYALAAQSSSAVNHVPLEHKLPRPSASSTQLLSRSEVYHGGLLLYAMLTSNRYMLTAPSSYSSDDPGSLPNPEHSSVPPEKVSDEEWDIRTGRAVYILQQTLPGFFETGLVSSLDNTTGEPSSSASKVWSLPNPTETWHTIKDRLTSTTKHKEEADETPSIYSPRVRLTYTPPVPLPAPLPKTLHAEGLHLYIASSIFVRHTLNALYTDLVVNISRLRVSNGGASQRSQSELSLGLPSTPKMSRDKSVLFGLTVSGLGRVSGVHAEWEVNCTYTFSPLTGLIIHHSVDSIEPAPHQALFEALGRFGLLEGGVGPKPGGVGQ